MWCLGSIKSLRSHWHVYSRTLLFTYKKYHVGSGDIDTTCGVFAVIHKLTAISLPVVDDDLRRTQSYTYTDMKRLP